MTEPTLKPGKNAVSYKSDGFTLAGHLYLPEDHREGDKRPAIVLTRPGSGVKEQTAGVYAKELSKHGFATLAFDPRGFGDSEGHEGVEDPFAVCEDTKNSISFMRTLDCVNASKVYNAGVCMGAGYAYYVTALDVRASAVGMISPYLNARDQIIEMCGGLDNIRGEMSLLTFAANARQNFFQTGKDSFVPPVPTDEAAASQPGVLPIQRGMMTYYLPGKPGGDPACPNWKNQTNLYNYESMLSFSAFNIMHMMAGVPVFMALGSEAYTVDNSKEFFENVTGPKEMHFVEGAGHFDLYWKPEHVTPIAKAFADFLRKHGAD